MGYFIVGLIFFIAMLSTMLFTIFLYVHLVIAVINNKDVPAWMYKVGHALKGRGADIYEDITDKSALNEVNLYIILVVIANIITYNVFYERYLENDSVRFWLFAEFFIIIIMRVSVDLCKIILYFIFSAIGKLKYKCSFSASANAVISMFIMISFTDMLTLTMTGIPVKAPVIQLGDYNIVVGHTTANDLLSNGFIFSDKNSNDKIVNKRDSHFYFGETVELIRDGKVYGYVNLTPKYEDESRLKDCIITYYGITSKSRLFSDVKICGKNISKLTLKDFEKMNIRDIFSLSPITYEESKGNEHFLLRMQTYPYMLWKRYSIEATFFTKDNVQQFEVYAQHILWE